MPGEDARARMAQLFVELLSSDGLPDLVCAGAWCAVRLLVYPNTVGSAAVCSLLLEMDICRLAATHLQRVGSPSEWVVSGQADALATMRAV